MAVDSSGIEPWTQVNQFENSYIWTTERDGGVGMAHGRVGDLGYGNDSLADNQLLAEDDDLVQSRGNCTWIAHTGSTRDSS